MGSGVILCAEKERMKRGVFLSARGGVFCPSSSMWVLLAYIHIRCYACGLLLLLLEGGRDSPCRGTGWVPIMQ